MWIIFALGSAFFAGVTAVLSKCGIRKTDSDVATAIRTGVVLLFSWLMVFIAGSADGITRIAPKTLVFLILSGLATGVSWLCYFKALQKGNVNQVVPIDKSSTVISILLAFVVLGEKITPTKAAAVVLIAAGTFLMTEKQPESEKSENGYSYIFYAVLSAVFAALTSILGKIGITDIESNLGTAIRTFVVLIMAWLTVFIKNKQKMLCHIPKCELLFIGLSGIATGASWLCYYKALKDGPAAGVVSIDKLSILITVAFSFVVFKERLSKKAALGLTFIVAGTLIMILG